VRNLLLVLMLGTAGLAQPAPVTELPYTRYLIPIFQNEMTGALGSRWQVDTWFYYSSAAPGGPTIVPSPFCRDGICFFSLHLLLDGEFQPLPIEPRSYPGTSVLLHVESQYAAAFTFVSRIRDVSREQDSAGTEIPVVHEDRIAEQPVRLLNVPIATKFRNMLRVYALPEIANPEVEVRYYRMTERSSLFADRTPLRIERLRLRTYAAMQGFLLHPSLAEVPGFESAPELAGQTALWIDVVPITPGLRIWAFVSITNNDTQQVTLVTPSGR
jgi:hypothetical protein